MPKIKMRAADDDGIDIFIRILVLHEVYQLTTVKGYNLAALNVGPTEPGNKAKFLISSSTSKNVDQNSFP